MFFIFFLCSLLLAPALASAAMPHCAVGAIKPAAKPVASLSISELSPTGRLHALTIFARFSDEVPRPIPQWNTQLFDPALAGSFSHFYDQMSFGALRVTGEVLGLRYATGTSNSYLSSEAGEEGRYGDFAQELLAQVDADLDFASFDNDGPDGIANSGDDDGWVDYIFINLQSVPTGFLLGTASGVVGLGFTVYTTGDLGIAGQPIRISGSAASGAIEKEGNFAQTVGTMAHEFGHSLGLADYFDRSFLFDRGQAPAEDSAGIGRWGLMGWGALGWDGNGGPTPFSARSLEQLGWISVQNGRLLEITADAQGLPATDLFSGGRVYRIPLRAEAVDNVSLQREYLLLEYRDATAHYYNRGQPASGLLVWHVRTQAADNDREEFKHLDLLCADGLYRDAGFPLGVVADPYSGRDNLDFWSRDGVLNRLYGGNLGDASDPFDGVRYARLAFDSNPSTLVAADLAEATTGLALALRRSRQGVDVDVRWPRWAGTLRREVLWSGNVFVDGDLTVAPEGRLVVFRNTQVRVAAGDRLAQGVDPERAEIRILGDMVIREAPISQISNSNVIRRDTTLFAAQEPGQTWAGIFVSPQKGSELMFPQGSYELRDTAQGLVVDGAPPVGESIDIKGFMFTQSRDELGRGIWQPGQTLRLALEVDNRSPLAFFTGVRAFVEWDSPALSPPRGSGRTRTVSFPSGEKQLFFFGNAPSLREDAAPGTQINLTLRVEKNGGRLWSGPFSIVVADDPTAVVEEASLPASFALQPNYPNPFNASTMIRYQLPRQMPVRLVVYNALGQQEQVLVDQVEAAGTREVRWEVGAKASGLYLIRLQSGSQSRSRPLLLLR
jgi:M6 family metalloprotease-like protein